MSHFLFMQLLGYLYKQAGTSKKLAFKRPWAPTVPGLPSSTAVGRLLQPVTLSVEEQASIFSGIHKRG